MSKNNIVIREIEKKDNAKIEQIIRASFPEFNIPLTGTAYEDEEIPIMFESFQDDNAIYYVIESNEHILGGGGIKQLQGTNNNVCELQKMYFSPEIRGKGFGKKLIEKCLKSAKDFGYEKCYLESAPQLKAAIHIYKSYGFKHLENALGNTGHDYCAVWMIKNLI